MKQYDPSMTRFECLAEDGRFYEADFPRDAAPEGLLRGVKARLVPRRVFAFPEEAAPT